MIPKQKIANYDTYTFLNAKMEKGNVKPNGDVTVCDYSVHKNMMVFGDSSGDLTYVMMGDVERGKNQNGVIQDVLVGFDKRVLFVKCLNNFLIAIGEDTFDAERFDQPIQGIPPKYQISVKVFRLSDMTMVNEYLLYTKPIHELVRISSVEFELNRPHRMIVSLDTENVELKSSVLIFQDVIRYDQKKPLVIQVQKNSSILSVALADYHNKPHLFVTTDKAVWRIEMEKKLMTKLYHIRSKIRPNCIAISDSNFNVFSPNVLGLEKNQFIALCLETKMVLLCCNDSIQPVDIYYSSNVASRAKVRAVWYKKYLLVHSKDKFQTSVISVFSLNGKFRYKAFEHTFSRNQSIELILPTEDRCILVIRTMPSDSSGIPSYGIIILDEKSMKTKLGILSKKFRYDEALELALKQQPNDVYNEEITDIMRKSGDYLFSAQEYEKAISRYLGEDLPGLSGKVKVEASYVIRKFLDAQINFELTKYLVKLHEQERADSEHTRLLINCYLREMQNGNEFEQERADHLLTEFLQNFRASSFNIPLIAINTLRKAGHRKRALEQAYMEPKQDRLIIQIETEDYPKHVDKWNFKRAVGHLQTLKDLKTTISLLEMYGSVYAKNIPMEVTNVLIRLCCPGYKPKRIEDKRRKYPQEDIQENSNDLTQFQKLKYGFSLFNALERITNNYESDDEVKDENDTEVYSYENQPERFIKIFSGNTYWLMVFLECVVYSFDENKRKQLSPVIFNTLLETYLEYLDDQEVQLPRDYTVPYSSIHDSDSPSTNWESLREILTDVQTYNMGFIKDYDYSIRPPTVELGKMSIKDRIMNLLSMEDPVRKIPLYDVEHALVLVQSAGFEEGILLLYAKLQLHYDILAYYKKNHDHAKVVEKCEEHGKKDPNMWIQVLDYFTQELQNGDKQSAEKHLEQVLNLIKRRDILPPLLVVQILSKNQSLEIGLIKDYLKEQLEKQQKISDKNLARINSLQSDTRRITNEIHDLRTSARIFQKQKCSADGCGKNLDLPAVHFMCMHSYHQRCLTNEDECQKCAKAHKQSLSFKKQTSMRSNQHELFSKMFNGSDGFSAVSHFFGLGGFDVKKEKNPKF